MMSEACYDPRAAIGLWTRMEEDEKRQGTSTPQFISTHPSTHNRLEKFAEWMPAAEAMVEQSECHSTMGYGQSTCYCSLWTYG